MELIRTRQNLDIVERKSEINIEDVLFIISGLCDDCPLTELPVGDAHEFGDSLRKWANMVVLLVKHHREKLIPEKSYSKLEKICEFFKAWEAEMVSVEKQRNEDIFDMKNYLTEYGSNEEKLIACMKLMSVFREHGELFDQMKRGLEYVEKELIIDMLQTEEPESISR